MFILRSTILELISRIQKEKEQKLPSGLPLQYGWLLQFEIPGEKVKLFDLYIEKLSAFAEHGEIIPWKNGIGIEDWLWSNKENNEHGLREWRRFLCDSWRWLSNRRVDENGKEEE